MNNYVDCPPDVLAPVANEKIARARKTNPYRYLPINTILRRIDPLQRRVLEGGIDAFEPGLEAKIQTLKALLVFEYALQAEESEVGLLKKLDTVVRCVPFLTYLRDLAPKEAPKPKTEAAVDNEMATRLKRLNAMIEKATKVPVAQVLDSLAPAAEQPAEEA